MVGPRKTRKRRKRHVKSSIQRKLIAVYQPFIRLWLPPITTVGRTVLLHGYQLGEGNFRSWVYLAEGKMRKRFPPISQEITKMCKLVVWIKKRTGTKLLRNTRIPLLLSSVWNCPCAANGRRFKNYCAVLSLLKPDTQAHCIASGCGDSTGSITFVPKRPKPPWQKTLMIQTLRNLLRWARIRSVACGQNTQLNFPPHEGNVKGSALHWMEFSSLHKRCIDKTSQT